MNLTERRQALEVGVSAKTFQLACAPAVNLFEQTAEPILITQRRFEYPIVPDVRRPNATEIFSVDEVVSVRPDTQEPVRFEPFYSYHHGTRPPSAARLSGWRRAALPDVATTKAPRWSFPSWISNSGRLRPDLDSLTVRLTCTNRDIPARLPFGMETGDFEMESAVPVQSIVALRKPTPALRPPTGRSSLWRLISHLSLNYLSLVSEGKEALQEILKLYDFTHSSYSMKQIEGILQLKSRPHFARILSENGITFARGTRVEMELDEDNFVGGGVYLFASVSGTFSGAVCHAQQLQPVERLNAPEEGGPAPVAPASRHEDPALETTGFSQNRKMLCGKSRLLLISSRLFGFSAGFCRTASLSAGFPIPARKPSVSARRRNLVFLPVRSPGSNGLKALSPGWMSISWGLPVPRAFCRFIIRRCFANACAPATVPCASFLDIFNHRAISLFYRAWEKHHFTVGYERNEQDPLSPHLMDLLGLGTPGLA